MFCSGLLAGICLSALLGTAASPFSGDESPVLWPNIDTSADIPIYDQLPIELWEPNPEGDPMMLPDGRGLTINPYEETEDHGEGKSFLLKHKKKKIVVTITKTSTSTLTSVCTISTTACSGRRRRGTLEGGDHHEIDSSTTRSIETTAPAQLLPPSPDRTGNSNTQRLNRDDYLESGPPNPFLRNENASVYEIEPSNDAFQDFFLPFSSHRSSNRNVGDILGATDEMYARRSANGALVPESTEGRAFAELIEKRKKKYRFVVTTTTTTVTTYSTSSPACSTSSTLLQCASG